MAIKKCKECGGEVSTKAEACPKCGAKVKRTSKAAIGCLGLILFVFFLAGIGAMVGDENPSSQARVNAPPAPPPPPVQEEAAPAPAPPAERWLKDSCKATAKNFGLSSKLTDLQKKAAWEQNDLAGAHFEWDLVVTSVDSTFGQVQAQFKCRGSRAFVSDVILKVEDDELALKLTKGKRYRVHGTLRDWSNFAGLSGTLVEIK